MKLLYRKVVSSSTKIVISRWSFDIFLSDEEHDFIMQASSEKVCSFLKKTLIHFHDLQSFFLKGIKSLSIDLGGLNSLKTLRITFLDNTNNIDYLYFYLVTDKTKEAFNGMYQELQEIDALSYIN